MAERDSTAKYFRIFVREFITGLRHHMLLLAGAAAVFATGLSMSLVSGHMFSPSLLDFAASYMGVAGFIVLLSIFFFKFFCMVLIERPPSPLAELARWVQRDLFNPVRLANGANGMIFVFLLISGFGMAKNNISRFGGFRWDEALSDLDRWLHFGFYPAELLQPLLGQPWITLLIDRVYVLWFPVLFASCFVVSFHNSRSALRHRFLLALLFTWGVGGTVFALLLSSAGPVYYAQVTGLADPYASHFSYLASVGEVYELKALAIQERLWADYQGTPSASLISAMPSMHVAMAVLVAVGCWVYGGVLRWAGAAFAALIFVGSVHLGWHYASDAYAGIAIACVAWLLAGRLTHWHLAGRSARPPREMQEFPQAQQPIR